jgi:mycofactocin biosynthetic radical S-adenosylmethionine protein MftC
VRLGQRKLSGLLTAKQRALELGQPLTAYLELTWTCPYRCAFCYNPRRAAERPLDTAEWVAVLDSLRVLGVLWVTLTGGEPLAFPGWLDVARAARERGMALRVFTSGALVDDAAADALAALHPASVELSIHGASAAVHDAVTGVPGSHDALLAVVRRLVARGVTTVLKAPLTRLGEHEAVAIMTLAERLGVPLRLDWMLTPRDDGDPSPLALAASPESVTAVMTRLHAAGRLPQATRTPDRPACGLGRLTVAVDPEGNVFPCIQWRASSLGNVRTAPLHELWRHSGERAAAADVATATNAALLARGDALAGYPYCPALAQALTGDPLAPSPEQVRVAEAAARVRSETLPVRLAGLDFAVTPASGLSATETASLGRLTGAELLPGARDRHVETAPWLVELVAAAPWQGAAGELPPRGTPAAVSVAGDAVLVRHREFAARIVPGTGSVALHRSGNGASPVEVALRVAMACRLPLEGGLPLHAAGLAVGGRGVVFFGPSGAGKSTIAAASPYPVFSDELVAVLPGDGDGFELSATGFWGTLAGRAAPRGFVPLAALVELGRGEETALTRLSAREALLALSGVVTIPASPALWSIALGVVGRLVAAVPVLRLAWTPERPPWREIESLLG